MIIVDSSAWIEQLRSPASSHGMLTELASTRVDAFATTEVILMEVLAQVRGLRTIDVR